MGINENCFYQNIMFLNLSHRKAKKENKIQENLNTKSRSHCQLQTEFRGHYFSPLTA